MKRAILAATALLSSTILISSQALAAVTVLDATPAANPEGLNTANLLLAQGVCDAAAAALDTDGSGEDSDIYTAEVVEGTATWVSGPTEVGSHTFAANGVGTQTGAGTFTPAHTEIEGDPFRNGGSVNMFGMAIAVGGHYSASSYDFEGEFTTTYAHPFTCDVSVATYYPESIDPGTGHYVIEDNYHGQDENAVRANCEQFTYSGQDWWGSSHAHCQFEGTLPTVIPAGHNAPEFVSNVAGGSYNQDQTDTLLAHEDAGEGFDTSETLFIGQVVVCISPKKLPGTWTKQNGYTGDKCTTAWYTSGAMVGVSNLNTGSHNWVTVPVN